MPDPVIPTIGPAFSQADLINFINDPRFASSRYAGIVNNAPSFGRDRGLDLRYFDPKSGVYNPSAADYVGAGPTIEFLGNIANPIGNVGAGLLGLAGAGYLGAENYLRSKGRQLLTNPQQIARMLDYPAAFASDLEPFGRLGKFGPNPNNPYANYMQALGQGGNVLGVLTKKGREAGRRRKQLEASAYADLFKTYMGDEGLLSKGLDEDSIARQAAQALFEADPVNAPVPPKASKRYVPVNVPGPGDIKTRVGYQRGAGQIAEGIQPTVATKILDLKKGVNPLTRGGKLTAASLVAKGLGMLAPIAMSKGADALAGWRADKDVLKTLKDGEVGPQGKAATSTLNERQSTQRQVIDTLINEGVSKGIIQTVASKNDPNKKIPIFSRDPKHVKLLQGWLGHMYKKVQAGKISPQTYNVFLEKVTKAFQQ